MNGIGWLESLVQDVRYAARSLRTSPLFTVIAVSTLAIGIGATTAIFSTVNATLLRPLPFPQPGQLIDIHTRFLDGRATTGLVSPVELGGLNALPSIVERAAGYGLPFEATMMRDDGTPVSVAMNGVTEGFFDALALPMLRGRGFTQDEHVPAGRDAPTAVVVSYRAWTTLFGGDPNLIGKTIRIPEARGATTVVGVASPDLDLPRGTDFWFNLRTSPKEDGHYVTGLVRLRPGAKLEQLRSAADVTMAELARTVPNDVGREFVLRSLVSSLVGELGPILLIVLGATALLLVLACVNVTNLLLARGMVRTREMAVRAAIGASRGRVVRQLLTESLVLATAGALAGLLLAFGAVRLMLLLGASKLPRLETVPVDASVLLFTLAVLLFTGLTMGLAPAWRLAGTDIKTLLNESGRTTTSSGATSRIMSTMIVGEIALAIALVAGAGWLVQSFARLSATNPGFTADGRLVVDVRPTRPFSRPAEAMAWSDDMLSRVRMAAGDAVVGSATTFPLRADRDGTTNIELEGEAPDPNRVRSGHMRTVTTGFFDAMGIKALAGRTFTVDDRSDTQRVVVVNRAFVRRYLADSDPLTVSIAFGFPNPDRKAMSRIVGVVQDVRYKSLTEEAEPTFYVTQAQSPYSFSRYAVVVDTHGGTPQALVSTIRAELQRFDPQLIVTFTTAPEIVSETLGRQELGMRLMLIFGATALALAAVGIYGVIAYAAAQRTGEIAMRMALGASRGHAFWLVTSAAQRLAVVGLLLGLAVAYAGGRLVASSVFEMRAEDPLVLIAACAIVVVVTAGATMIPAFRASRLDPVRALRSE